MIDIFFIYLKCLDIFPKKLWYYQNHGHFDKNTTCIKISDPSGLFKYRNIPFLL